MKHNAKAECQVSATVQANTDILPSIALENHYHIEAHDSEGNLKWVEDIFNRVPTEGLNDILTKYLKGSSYTATWFVGLIDNASFGSLQATDTAAKISTTANPPTTNDWQESTAYSESVRQALTLGTASAGSIDNSASRAVFSINATKTINGAFVISNSTKGGTSGVLYGEASFSSPRSLVNGDTLTITITLTASTA